MSKKLKNIAILGAGTMGVGIGLLFAMKDYPVKLIYSCEQDKTSNPLGRMHESLKILSNNGVVDRSKMDAIMANVSTTDNLEEGATFADIIFECIIEDLSIKQDFFKKLDEMCTEDTVLASNTSAISITEIAETSENKSRIIGTHFWNPPFLIPLVEVIKTEFVSEDTVNRVHELLEEAGKKPVIVNKDVPGFLANRMQHALFREALYIIEQGIAEPSAVDDAIKYGFGMRLGIMAPVGVMDMGGLDLTYAIHEYLFKDLCNDTKPAAILSQKLSEGKLGFKSGEGLMTWTQEKIAQERKHLTEDLIKVARALDRL
ncbi:3-hydroxyacyl-CoA dehydrogenase family protein [Fusibacter ferrireducens]|uniref:L-gulonate 3-dehydrogenase n=1 Tax=Fusibacter ferrireducens TaxID=2785058 RepID=A0ABR9ZW76_9FIRM|nr:3-hydroxyacyl-CoA dehydrogenase NAD-binding domain-containing protein [Fusibacter ferrireducens]MBF4694717.1 3-hydroxyacyl-CoA dehydrogenase family protein [Fusibacter ferrireducens]